MAQYKPNQLRGKKGGLFQRLGRAPSPETIHALRPPEPRAAELIYRSWVRAFWKIWRHVVLTELDSFGSGMPPDFAARMHALLAGSGLIGVLNRVSTSVIALVSRYMQGIFKAGARTSATGLHQDALESIPRLRPFNAQQALEIDKWRLENLRLIKNATDEHVAALFKIFKDAQEQGIARGELAAQVDQVLNDGYQRAMLIASDQTTKFNGTIQQVQQTAAGITEFVWSTSHDGAVRPTHRALDGRKFKWAVGAPDGPNLVLPGQPVRCRCQPIPVIELFAGID